jgi:uncharacterized cupredoxin-like copper-binding protein
MGWSSQSRPKASRLLLRHVAVAVAAFSGLSACSEEGSPPASSPPAASVPSASATATTLAEGPIGIELREFSITPEATDLRSGSLTFVVKNVGDYRHEFLIVELQPGTDEPPTASTGAMKEDAPGVEVLGRITKTTLTPDQGGRLTLKLEPGNYVFACNLVIGEVGSNAPIESHYGRGMHTAFTIS